MNYVTGLQLHKFQASPIQRRKKCCD